MWAHAKPEEFGQMAKAARKSQSPFVQSVRKDGWLDDLLKKGASTEADEQGLVSVFVEMSELMAIEHLAKELDIRLWQVGDPTIKAADASL